MKYEKVWRDKSYRAYSPGERLAAEAVKDLGAAPGDSIIDFGCGTGRAAAELKRLGLDVRGCDIADNALEVEGIPFTRACLWSLPAPYNATWGFCADVMEHIPPEKVDDVIEAIRSRVSAAAYFQIHLRKDGSGPRIIGEPLHLTIQPAHWWQTRLLRRWNTVEMREKGSQALYVCRT